METIELTGQLHPHHFFQCVHGVHGVAYCQPCALDNPRHFYSLTCDQCMFKKDADKCISTNTL